MLRIKDGATLAIFVMFCENSFYPNLKTSKVKYIKVYVSQKEISKEIYINSQIFW